MFWSFVRDNPLTKLQNFFKTIRGSPDAYIRIYIKIVFTIYVENTVLIPKVQQFWDKKKGCHLAAFFFIVGYVNGSTFA